jgi:hypothetical protein
MRASFASPYIGSHDTAQSANLSTTVSDATRILQQNHMFRSFRFLGRIIAERMQYMVMNANVIYQYWHQNSNCSISAGCRSSVL